MTQESLKQKYLEMEESHEIRFDSASAHIKSEIEHYKPLQEGVANPNNFFDGTVAIFHEVSKPRRKADYVSLSGSRYWYKKEGLIRGSNHWGNRIVNCDWALMRKNAKNIYGTSAYTSTTVQEELFGYVKWEDIILKTRLLTIRNKEIVTTFNNKLSLDVYKVGKKKYRCVVEVHWREVK